MAIKNDEGQIYTQELGGILLAKSIDDKTEIKSIACEDVTARAVELGFGYELTAQQTGLASSGVHYYQIETPDTDYLITNTLNSASCVDSANNKTGIMKMCLFEGATTTADGGATGISIANFNRNTLLTNEFTFTYAPTITDNGTLLVCKLISANYALVQGITYQMKANTKYLIQVTNTSDVTIDYMYGLTFFQIPN